jgi:urease accessory protein
VIDLLAALQLADSFFPSGMYTQSHGLERFIELGLRGEAQLGPLLHAYLLHVSGPADALAARLACRAAQATDLQSVAAVDARLEAIKLAAEPRAASRRCGGRVLLLGDQLFPQSFVPAYTAEVSAGRSPGHQAVALALLAAASGLDESAAAQIELHAFSVSLLSAAVRLGALDHIGAQRLLLHARPVMAEAAARGVDGDCSMIGEFAPGIELMQLQHQWALGHMFAS